MTNGSLVESIRDRLGDRGTDELLHIWRTNDRASWSVEAFEAIKEILSSRGVDVPEQEEAKALHPSQLNYGTRKYSAREALLGRADLATTFWMYFALPNVAFGCIFVIMARTIAQAPIVWVVLALAYFIYWLVAAVAIWISAGRYTGRRLWSFAARAMVLIGGAETVFGVMGALGLIK